MWRIISSNQITGLSQFYKYETQDMRSCAGCSPEVHSAARGFGCLVIVWYSRGKPSQTIALLSATRLWLKLLEFCGENPFTFLCSLSDPFIICYSLYLCYTCLQWIFWPLLIYSVAHILTDTQTNVLFLDIYVWYINNLWS